MAYSRDSLLGEVLADSAAVEVIEQFMPGAASNPMVNMVRHLTLDQVASMPQAGLSQELLEQMIEELNK